MLRRLCFIFLFLSLTFDDVVCHPHAMSFIFYFLFPSMSFDEAVLAYILLDFISSVLEYYL